VAVVEGCPEIVGPWPEETVFPPVAALVVAASPPPPPQPAVNTAMAEETASARSADLRCDMTNLHFD
jgi:hypothetical protein